MITQRNSAPPLFTSALQNPHICPCYEPVSLPTDEAMVCGRRPLQSTTQAGNLHSWSPESRFKRESPKEKTQKLVLPLSHLSFGCFQHRPHSGVSCPTICPFAKCLRATLQGRPSLLPACQKAAPPYRAGLLPFGQKSAVSPELKDFTGLWKIACCYFARRHFNF